MATGKVARSSIKNVSASFNPKMVARIYSCILMRLKEVNFKRVTPLSMRQLKGQKGHRLPALRLFSINQPSFG